MYSDLKILVLIIVFCGFVNYGSGNVIIYDAKKPAPPIRFMTEEDHDEMPASVLIKKFNKFLDMYERALKNSPIYKKARIEDKYIFDNQIEDIKNLLRYRTIENEEDLEIYEWVKELVELSEYQLWKLLNLVFSGNLFFGYIKDENIRRREEL